jgi:hypothetical protein
VYYSAGWTVGRRNVIVGYEHGLDRPPERIKRGGLLLLKRWLVEGPVDDRTTSMSNDDGTFSWRRRAGAGASSGCRSSTRRSRRRRTASAWPDGSSDPSPQDALKAILTARTAWADVIVTDGGPTEGEDIRFDMFWFNDVQIPQDGWAFIGGQTRRISFLLGFTIAVRKYGDDEHATRAARTRPVRGLHGRGQGEPDADEHVQQTGDVTGTFASMPVGPPSGARVHRLPRLPVELLLDHNTPGGAT